MAKVALDTKWRTLKNFSKIYAKILEEEREREVALATAIAEVRRRPCLTLHADGCVATDCGDAILEKSSGCVTLKQQKKRKLPPHRSNSLESWDGDFRFKGVDGAHQLFLEANIIANSTKLRILKT